MLGDQVVQIGECPLIGGEEHLQLSLPPLPEIKEKPVVGEFVECSVKRDVALNCGAEVVVIGALAHGVESSLYTIAPGTFQSWHRQLYGVGLQPLSQAGNLRDTPRADLGDERAAVGNPHDETLIGKHAQRLA